MRAPLSALMFIGAVLWAGPDGFGSPSEREGPLPDQGPGRPAHGAGDFDGEIGLDYLRAGSFQDAAGGGDPQSIVAQEAGVRVRLRAHELDRRLSVDVDYRGREPIDGDVEDSPLRLLYAGEVRYAAIERTLTLGLGRFIAPSLAFLPIDGGRVDLAIDPIKITPFFGRRAITTALRNVELSTFLPAAGVSAAYEDEILFAEATYAFSRDRAALTKGSAGLEDTTPYDSSTAQVRAIARLIPELNAGGQLAFAQRATYVIGPTWTSVQLDVHAADLVTGVFFLDWRPLEILRFTYTLDSQKTEISREGIVAGTPPTLTPTLLDPTFTDNTFKAAWRGFEIGWLRGEFRWRVRPDRRELRFGAGADVDRIGVPGLFLRGYFAYEHVAFDATVSRPPDLDRALWSGSVGWRHEGIDLEGGMSFIERTAGPLSGRVFNHDDPMQPTRPVDLSPFVLEAERIAFVRAFWGTDAFFAGLDAEQNLLDRREQRFFLQIGGRMEATW